MSAASSSECFTSLSLQVYSSMLLCVGVAALTRGTGRLDRLERKAGSVVGIELEGITSTAEK